MNPEDPRAQYPLLRRIDPNANQPGALPVRKAVRPPTGARCAQCGALELSSVPTFSTGSGIASRPFAEDVICHTCGHLGPPAL